MYVNIYLFLVFPRFYSCIYICMNIQLCCTQFSSRRARAVKFKLFLIFIYMYTTSIYVYIYIIISQFPPSYKVQSLVRIVTSQSDLLQIISHIYIYICIRTHMCTYT